MIRKALIPIAGLGRRLYPLTKVIPKAMLPLPLGEVRLLPIVHWICAEAAEAGVERVLLITSTSHRELLRGYFDTVDPAAPPKLPGEIEFSVQSAPKGFGDAVARGADFIGDAPFLLLLGDHVYKAGTSGKCCAGQVVRAFEQHGGVAMIGVRAVGCDELPRVGVVGGELLGQRVYRCTDFIEKPSHETAARRLVTPGVERGKFLAHCGIYVFAPEIFEGISRLSRRDRPPEKELELAEAQTMLLRDHPEEYLLYWIDGRCYDTGTPANYTRAFAAFAARGTGA